MRIRPNARAKLVVMLVSTLPILAVCLVSAMPRIGKASGAANDLALTASINVPLNQIQEGQWCVAYANVYNGSGNYQYLCGGSYFSGTTHTVGAYMWGENGYVTLRVIDTGVTPWDTVWAPSENLQVESGYDYNPDCEA